MSSVEMSSVEMSSVEMSSVEIDYKIKAMVSDDLASVMVNERASYSHPWSEAIFADCIRAGNECWLVVIAGEVYGHGILSVAAGESHLLNACINPAIQGQGFGRILVEFMLTRAAANRVRCVFLEVRPSNLVAYKLYESLGFVEVGVRKDYYPTESGREDAIVFSRLFDYEN